MKIGLMALCVLPFFSSAQEKGKTVFVISGNVKGLAEKSIVFAKNVINHGDTLAQTVVGAGHFTLRGHLDEPGMVEIYFVSAKQKYPVFIGNDQIQIEGLAENLRELKVSGSSANNDFMEFQQNFNPYFIKLNELSQLANSPAGAGKSDSISRTYAGLVITLQSKLDQFIQRKKESYFSAFILTQLQLSDDVFLLEKRYNFLSAPLKESYYGRILRQQIETGKIGAIGTKALEFTQNDTMGKPVSLSSYKGKYVLVDFWASWCHPCRMENPNVIATYGKFKNKNFTILGVSLDRSRDPWVKAILEDNLPWAQVSDLKFWNNEVALKYKIQSIPQNFLIDPEGNIIGKNLRGPELDAKLCELFGCN